MTDRPPLWTDDQVASLTHRQSSGEVHPYTCPGDRECCANQRELKATPDGWVCACGEYRQRWARGYPSELPHHD